MARPVRNQPQHRRPLVFDSTLKELAQLFTLDAEYYLREHLACMYPLLPTMQNVNREVIGQALDEPVALYCDDEVTLAQQFAWMEILLERAAMVPPQEKDEIQRWSGCASLRLGIWHKKRSSRLMSLADSTTRSSSSFRSPMRPSRAGF